MSCWRSIIYLEGFKKEGTLMFWIVIIIIVALVAASLESIPGKIVAGAAVVAIGLLLLSWITGLSFLITLAKVCAAIIVITIVGTILLALIG